MVWPFRNRLDVGVATSITSSEASAILRRARRLRFRVRPSALNRLVGAYHGARPGTGLTFTELRPYEPGDDVRHLDWNVTARQGRPYVRRFTEERALDLWLVVDVSASMRFGLPGVTKLDRAVQAAALLAAAAIQSADRVGLILVSDRPELEIPPAAGTRQLSRVVRALVATPACSGETRLEAGLLRIRRRAHRSMIVVLADFLTEESSGIWKRLAVAHDLLALRVVHPLEERLPDAGLIGLTLAEGSGRLMVDTASSRLRRDYERQGRAQARAFLAWCTTMGLEGGFLSTEVDPIIPLTALFERRAKRRGAP